MPFPLLKQPKKRKLHLPVSNRRPTASPSIIPSTAPSITRLTLISGRADPGESRMGEISTSGSRREREAVVIGLRTSHSVLSSLLYWVQSRGTKCTHHAIKALHRRRAVGSSIPCGRQPQPTGPVAGRQAAATSFEPPARVAAGRHGLRTCLPGAGLRQFDALLLLQTHKSDPPSASLLKRTRKKGRSRLSKKEIRLKCFGSPLGLEQ